METDSRNYILFPDLHTARRADEGRWASATEKKNDAVYAKHRLISNTNKKIPHEFVRKV